VSVEFGQKEIYRGRVLSVTKDFDNIKQIYCEGNLAYLVDSVQKGEEFKGKTHGFFKRIIDGHNAMMESSKRFKVGKITIPDVDIIVDGKSDKIQDYETLKFDYKQVYINGTVDNWKTTFEYIIEYLISYCGGYLRTRTEKDGVYLDYLLEYDHEAIQGIEFGINMLELNEEVSSEDLFTVLIPLGDENLTIEKVNNGSAELVDAKAVAQFERILRTHVFNNVTNPSMLLENAKRYQTPRSTQPPCLSPRPRG